LNLLYNKIKNLSSAFFKKKSEKFDHHLFEKFIIATKNVNCFESTIILSFFLTIIYCPLLQTTPLFAMPPKAAAKPPPAIETSINRLHNIRNTVQPNFCFVK